MKEGNNYELEDVLILKQINSKDGRSYYCSSWEKITSPYRFEPVFNKVGLDELPMQHCRRVKWYIPTDGLVIDKEGLSIGLQKLKDDSPLKNKSSRIYE